MLALVSQYLNSRLHLKRKKLLLASVAEMSGAAIKIRHCAPASSEMDEIVKRKITHHF